MHARSILTSVSIACAATQALCFAPALRRTSRAGRGGGLLVAARNNNEPVVICDDASNDDTPSGCRRRLLSAAALSVASLAVSASPQPASAKCADIESCREEGERRVEEDLRRNPIVRLSDGVRYRVLAPPVSPSDDNRVREGSIIDLAYSISTASGQYMYSRGMGYEKVEFGGRMESDLGLDSMRAVIGKHDVPIGIESALMGMGRGEKRRVELPPAVGFETSNWSPEPTTRRGRVQIEQYRKKLAGFGSQPPFPAETVWDIEVLQVRN